MPRRSRRHLAIPAAILAAAWAGPRGQALGEDDGAAEAATRDAIETILRVQAEAWNRGDIEAFLGPYWKSDGLTFSSGGEVRRGFEATRKRYLDTYPDRRAMGSLAFSGLEVMTLGPDAALVLGDWRLERDAGPLGGTFTLVLRRIEGAWTIIHDHTSRRPAAT